MLHGMIVGSLANWYFSVAPALAADHRVLMYDLRGHGLTELTPGGYGIGSMVSDLRHVIEHFALDAPVTVVGHSYGAIVALRFAIDHPQLVDRVVVVEAPLPITASTTVEVLLSDVSGETGADDEVSITPEFIEKLVNESVHSALQPLPAGQQEAIKGKGRRARRSILRGQALLQTTILTDLVEEPDITDDDLATCRAPVLLCYGLHTLPVMTATCARLAATLPVVRVRMFDAGHFLPREQPRQLAEAIREFLDA
jgi:pimeloyl-ACP methyl ester carboxylesterase